jgi:hypothetical protein
VSCQAGSQFPSPSPLPANHRLTKGVGNALRAIEAVVRIILKHFYTTNIWFNVVVHVNGVRLCLWTMATNAHIVHPTGDISVWTAMAELYWQENHRTWRKLVPVPLCLPQIPHMLTWA